MKIGVIIPTRGDRPLFLKNCLRLIKNQTLQPYEVYFVDDPPTSDQCDITKRYRLGYDYFRNKGMDVLFFMEDDDWYHQDYLRQMVAQWVHCNKPELFGTNYTIYYNIRLFKYFTMRHTRRSATMSTMILPDMDFDWCRDQEAYVDSHLWFCAKHIKSGKKLDGKVFRPEHEICVGIKHGIGKTGGENHTTFLHRYLGNGATDDSTKIWLKKTVDFESFEFYSTYFNK